MSCCPSRSKEPMQKLLYLSLPICWGFLFLLVGCSEKTEIATDQVPTVSSAETPSSEGVPSSGKNTSETPTIIEPVPAVASSAESESPPTPEAQEPENVNALPSLDELLLFYPAKYPAGNWEPTGLQFEDVWFEADDGAQLHGWYCPVKDPQAVVLYAHGNAGNLAHRSPLLEFLQKELQVSVLIFD